MLTCSIKNHFMAYRFFLVFIISGFSVVSFSQTKLGEVASIYVTSPNLDSSVALYEKIGFLKIASNVMPAPWALVSDGSLLIMMRKDSMKYVGLTYYVKNIESTVAQMDLTGRIFGQRRRRQRVVRAPRVGLRSVMSHSDYHGPILA